MADSALRPCSKTGTYACLCVPWSVIGRFGQKSVEGVIVYLNVSGQDDGAQDVDLLGRDDLDGLCFGVVLYLFIQRHTL